MLHKKEYESAVKSIYTIVIMQTPNIDLIKIGAQLCWDDGGQQVSMRAVRWRLKELNLHLL